MASPPKFDPTLVDDNIAYQIYATVGVAAFFAITSTAIRVGVKLNHRLPLNWDDYLIILGTCLNIIADSFDVSAGVYGFGRHLQFLAIPNAINAKKFAELAVLFAVFAKCAIKISICFFLLNIIKGTHRRFATAIHVLLGLTLVTTFICALLWGLQSKPIEGLWDPLIPAQRQTPEQFLYSVYVIYAFGVVTDFLYSISPIYFLWNVKIPLWRKLTILGLTGCGLLVTVVAFIDIGFATEFLNETDPTRALIPEFICDILERNIGGFIANLPAIWILFQRRESKNSSSNYALDSGNHKQGVPLGAPPAGNAPAMKSKPITGPGASFDPTSSTVVTGGRGGRGVAHKPIDSSDDSLPLTDPHNPGHFQIGVSQNFYIERGSQVREHV